MKRLTAMVLAVLMTATLAGCGSAAPAGNTDGNAAAANTGNTVPAANTGNTENTAPADNTPSGGNEKKTLVVVFSATGTTKGVAEKIAKIEGADLYEIKAAQEYTSADLNWHDNSSRTTKEQNDKSVRPQIGSEKISLDGYSRIYIGYPIWWGEEPRIMDTFVESYSFEGKTVIPFCTSGGSGIGRSGKNLAENAKSGSWKDGARLGGNASEADLKAWIDGIK